LTAKPLVAFDTTATAEPQKLANTNVKTPSTFVSTIYTAKAVLRCNKTTTPVATQVSTLQVTAHLALESVSPRSFLTPMAENMVIVENTKNATHSWKRGLRGGGRACPVSRSMFMVTVI